MTMTVDKVSSYGSPYVQKKNVTGETTITPFSEVIKQETEVVKKTEKSQTAETSQKASSSENFSVNVPKSLEDIFRRASEKYGVSYDFLTAVAKAESNFNPQAVSSAGAQGVMQLMPETARDLGVKDAFDPEQNIMGAAKLLAAHLKKFDGNTTLAAAAYNAGSGRVLQYGGVPPFEETQNYVKKIAKYMNQGVEVPDTKVATSDSTKKEVLGAVSATQEELEQSMVTVGAGEHAIHMTYGAYQRYLELGDLGVG